MSSKPKRIFVADDDEDILDIIGMILRTEQYEVIATTNGNEVFDLTEPPDLILLDIWMSGYDGREICKKLKEEPRTKNIPLLFVSANSSIADISQLCNADGFIAKPFEMEYLLKTVGSFMQKEQDA